MSGKEIARGVVTSVGEGSDLKAEKIWKKFATQAYIGVESESRLRQEPAKPGLEQKKMLGLNGALHKRSSRSEQGKG